MNAVITPVIHMVWFGGSSLPQQHVEWIDSVARHNPGFGPQIWHEGDMASLGVTVDRLKDEFGSWASVSNFVRLLILQRHGGCYLDTDFECFKPLAPLFEHSGAVAAEQDGGRICNAFLMAERNHPWINWQLANIGRYDRRDAAWGVYAATDAPRDGLTIIDQKLVYPYLYTAALEDRKPHPDSLLSHAWAGSWAK